MLKKVINSVAVIVGLTLVLAIAFLLALRFYPATALGFAQTLVPNVEIDAPELRAELLPLRLHAPALRVAGESFELDARELHAVVRWQNYFSDEPMWEGDVEFVSVSLAEPGEVAVPEPGQKIEPAGVDPDLVRRALRTLARLRVGELVIGDDFRLSLDADKRGGDIVVDGTSRIGAHRITLDGALIERDGFWVGDFAFSWARASHSALGRFRGEVALQPGEAIVRFDGSEVNVSETGTLLVGVADLNGELAWSRQHDRLTADGLSGRVRLDAAAYATTLTGTASGVRSRPELDIAIDFGATQGTLVGVVSEAEVDARVSVSSDELPHFVDPSPFAGQDLVPGSISARLRFADGRLALEDIVLASPANEVAGFARTRFEPPYDLDLQLSGPRLYLPLAGEGAPQATGQAADAAQQDELDAPIFSAQPLDFGFLHRGSGRVDVRADRFRLEEAGFDDFRLRAALADGALEIDDFAADYEAGGFEVSGGLLAVATDAGEAADARLQIDLHGVTLDQLGLLPSEQLNGGRIRAQFDVTSQGASPLELASTLRGDLLVVVRDAQLQNELVELVGSDVLMELVDKLNPFHRADPVTDMKCAVIHFEIEDGVLDSDNEIFFETDKMKVVGGGKVDLASEKLDITLTPHARKGVGVNVSSVVKFMKVGGTIRSPALGVDGKGLLHSGAVAGAALATGGLSILAEGLAKRVLDGGSACDAERFARERE